MNNLSENPVFLHNSGKKIDVRNTEIFLERKSFTSVKSLYFSTNIANKYTLKILGLPPECTGNVLLF